MSIRKPRRHERLAIYKKMLKTFEADTQYAVCTGFCRELYTINEGLKRSYYIEDYSELIKYRPHRLGVGDYWCSIKSNSRGREIRMKVLREIIKEMSK